jgi:small acid-soluble spore protein I (minor)
MDTDIRKYIQDNLKDCTEADIRETILASVNSKDEVVLPGLGVLFEMAWDNCENEIKENIVKTLFKVIKKAN